MSGLGSFPLGFPLGFGLGLVKLKKYQSLIAAFYKTHAHAIYQSGTKPKQVIKKITETSY